MPESNDLARQIDDALAVWAVQQDTQMAFSKAEEIGRFPEGLLLPRVKPYVEGLDAIQAMAMQHVFRCGWDACLQYLRGLRQVNRVAPEESVPPSYGADAVMEAMKKGSV